MILANVRLIADSVQAPKEHAHKATLAASKLGSSLRNMMQWDCPPCTANPAGVDSLAPLGLMMQDSLILPDPIRLGDNGLLAPYREEEQPPCLAFVLPPPSSPLTWRRFNGCRITGTRKRSNSLVDEEWESMDVAGLPLGLRTPQSAKHNLEDRQSTIKVPRTPQRTKDVASLSFVSPVEATPETKKCISATPPSGPVLLQKRLEDDIDAALDWHSLPLLSLALSRSHCCGQDHVIFEAVRRQNLRALRFLLESGYQEVDQQCGGRRPLQLALSNCMVTGDTGYKMAEMLLQYGASPNAKPGGSSQDEQGCDSLLHDAMQRGCVAAVELLLRFGSDANTRDKDGITAMHLFAQHPLFQVGNPLNKALSILLNYGACPFAMDRYGNDPLDFIHDKEKANRQVLLRAQRWWSQRSVMQVCQIAGGCDGAFKNFIPWALPEIGEVILKFLAT